jgi:hypothetical protein
MLENLVDLLLKSAGSDAQLQPDGPKVQGAS